MATDLEWSAQFEFETLEKTEIMTRIENIWNMYREDKKSICFIDLAKSNVEFIEDRITFADPSKTCEPKETRRKALWEVLEIIYNAFQDSQATSNRALWHQAKRFGKQSITNRALHDVCCLLKCSRLSLNIFASNRGEVYGPLAFWVGEIFFDCESIANLTMYGQQIPPFVKEVTNIELKEDEDGRSARYILFVEKHATFQKLLQSELIKRDRCILITGDGMPDIATRQFMSMMVHKLKLPCYGLVDCDPFGLHILSVITFGSERMPYDNHNMLVKNMQWIGVLPSHFPILIQLSKTLGKPLHPRQMFQDLEEADYRRIESMLGKEYVKKRPLFVRELKLMMHGGKKMDIGALDVKTLVDIYLPNIFHLLTTRVGYGYENEPFTLDTAKLTI